MDGWMMSTIYSFRRSWVRKYVCVCEATIITRYVVIDDVMASASARESVYGFILWAAVLLFSIFF